MVLSVPLPALPWSDGSQAGLMEVLLEEWLLRPLQSLAAVRPVAEFYRLKRKMVDSPFRRETVAFFSARAVFLGRVSFRVRLSPTDQALLVADQFAVTFDGHLRELPGSCPLLLAQDVGADPSFTLLLNADSHSFLLIGLNEDTVSVQKNGQVLLPVGRQSSITRPLNVNKAFVSQVRVNCNTTVSHTFHGNRGLAVRVRANVMQLSNQNGVSVSCDLLRLVCSFTLEGWLHGRYYM